MIEDSFKPMLAEAPDPKWPLRFPFLASPKLDGIRCFIGGQGPVTRKLKALPNRRLREALSNPHLRGLDGELIAGDPTHPNAMQATTSAVMSHHGDWSQVTFFVFDWLQPGLAGIGFSERQQPLEAWLEQCQKATPVPVVLLPQSFIGHQLALEQYTEAALAKGYEGVILRDPAGRYKFGRSTAREQLMLKIKPWEDAEGFIIGFEESTENQNELERDELGYAKRSSAAAGKVGKGTLGAVILQIEGWKASTVRVGNGPGLTAALRQEIWDNQYLWAGKLVKFKFQRVGSLDAPRIPQWLGLRSPED